MTVVAGVDGCRGGWLTVALDTTSGAQDIYLAAAWRTANASAALICVDMPIGLADMGPRECDIRARRTLGRARGASVFPAPNRPVLRFATWERANAWGKRRGRGLPRQTWALIDKIRELDSALQPADQERVYEAHPELVFKLLNGDEVPPPKRDPAGRARRHELLEARGFARLEVWLKRWPQSLVKADDVMDACALSLAAERILRGQAIRLPPAPPTDARGLRMEIWY